MPTRVPPPLQMRTSRIQWSHQHSEKLASWCSSEYSRNSNVTDITKKLQASDTGTPGNYNLHKKGTGTGRGGLNVKYKPWDVRSEIRLSEKVECSRLFLKIGLEIVYLWRTLLCSKRVSTPLAETVFRDF